jgi:hypothetical protein
MVSIYRPIDAIGIWAVCKLKMTKLLALHCCFFEVVKGGLEEIQLTVLDEVFCREGLGS